MQAAPALSRKLKAFATKVLNGADPVGRRFRRNSGAWLEIVGVVNDIRRGGKTDDINPQVYLSAAQTKLNDSVSVLTQVNQLLTQASQLASQGAQGGNGPDTLESLASQTDALITNVLNLANNHSLDYGPAGREQTLSALRRAHVAHTGLPYKVTILRAHGTRPGVPPRAGPVRQGHASRCADPAACPGRRRCRGV